MKALIAAGGRATRLRPITHSMNKHLIPLANKPMIFYAIEKIAECGIKEIAINVNPGEREIQQVVGDGSSWGVNITYLEQKFGPKGLAHVVANAEEWIGSDAFLFYLGDNIILNPITALVEKFERERLDCLLCLSRVQDPQRFGVPEFKDGKIVRVIEKPLNPPSDFAVTGIYLYRTPIFDAVKSITPSDRDEFEISDAHSWLIEHGYVVGFHEITGWWKDTGQPEDLIKGNESLLKIRKESEIDPDAMLEEGAVIEGIVSIGSGTRIDGASVIRGPVCIGANCIIEGSRIGPDVSIADRVVVRNTTITRSIVMNQSVIENGPPISLSMIGRNVRAVAQKNVDAPHRVMLGDGTLVEW